MSVTIPIKEVQDYICVKEVYLWLININSINIVYFNGDSILPRIMHLQAINQERIDCVCLSAALPLVTTSCRI